MKNEEMMYHVHVTDTGSWLHAPSSDFLFAYIDSSLDPTSKTALTTAFENALKMSSIIKQAVVATSGTKALNGLYLLNQAEMTVAMNSIDGMGETLASNGGNSGSGTAISINQEFFAGILGGLGGDVAPMMAYLNDQMSKVQAQTKNSTITDDFGVVVGLISLMPVLNVPVTTFKYIFSSSSISSWFVDLVCVDIQSQSYAYTYTDVDYNYNAPAPELIASHDLSASYNS
jgi:hypothetical protein